MFQALGKDWQVPGNIYEELEEFVCLMYGYERYKKVNQVRSLMLKKWLGVIMTKLKRKQI